MRLCIEAENIAGSDSESMKVWHTIVGIIGIDKVQHFENILNSKKYMKIIISDYVQE